MEKLFTSEFLDILKKIISNENINSVDKDGRSLLTNAVLLKNIAAVEFLILNGANIDQRDNNGWTPLHHASNDQNLGMILFLLENGADLNALDNYGNTPLSRATYSSKGKGEVILALLKAGADPMIKNNYGVSAKELANKIANYNVKQFFEL